MRRRATAARRTAASARQAPSPRHPLPRPKTTLAPHPRQRTAPLATLHDLSKFVSWSGPRRHRFRLQLEGDHTLWTAPQQSRSQRFKRMPWRRKLTTPRPATFIGSPSHGSGPSGPRPPMMLGTSLCGRRSSAPPPPQPTLARPVRLQEERHGPLRRPHVDLHGTQRCN
jgi:hypothetical protein